MSEGRLLFELMRILGFSDRTGFRIVLGRKKLVEELENAEDQYIHISAHGRFNLQSGTWLNTPHKGRVYSNDLTGLWAEKQSSHIPSLIVLSACEAGHMDMINAFYAAGCRYCLAPLHEALFEDAAIFLSIFYKLLIGEKMSPWISYRNTYLALSNYLPKLTGAWSFYEKGKKYTCQ